MSTPVPRLPPQGASTSLVIGAPASATAALAFGQAGAFVHGRAVAPVYAGGVQYAHTGLSYTLLVYVRRPGVESLRVVVELHKGSAVGSRAKVGASLYSGTGTLPTPPWQTGAGGYALDGGMDAATAPSPTALLATNRVLADYPRFEGFLDVSDLTVGLPAVLKITADEYGVTGPNGIRSLSLFEVPVPTHDPVSDPTYEPGVDAAWTQGGNSIVDGSAGSPRGVGRLLQTFDSARAYCPFHWQIARNVSYPWSRNSTALGAITDVPRWRARAKALRGTGTACPVRFGAIYRYAPTYANVGLSLLRMTATGVLGSTVNTDLPLLDTSGAWLYDEINGSWPCDGTAQEVELSFSARTSNTDGMGHTTSNAVEIASLFVLGRAP